MDTFFSLALSNAVVAAVLAVVAAVGGRLYRRPAVTHGLWLLVLLKLLTPPLITVPVAWRTAASAPAPAHSAAVTCSAGGSDVATSG